LRCATPEQATEQKRFGLPCVVVKIAPHGQARVSRLAADRHAREQNFPRPRFRHAGGA
jgi:hypothetical protein